MEPCVVYFTVLLPQELLIEFEPTLPVQIDGGAWYSCETRVLVHTLQHDMIVFLFAHGRT